MNKAKVLVYIEKKDFRSVNQEIVKRFGFVERYLIDPTPCLPGEPEDYERSILFWCDVAIQDTATDPLFIEGVDELPPTPEEIIEKLKEIAALSQVEHVWSKIANETFELH